jgi:hypothetical protein
MLDLGLRRPLAVDFVAQSPITNHPVFRGQLLTFAHREASWTAPALWRFWKQGTSGRNEIEICEIRVICVSSRSITNHQLPITQSGPSPFLRPILPSVPRNGDADLAQEIQNWDKYGHETGTIPDM